MTSLPVGAADADPGRPRSDEPDAADHTAVAADDGAADDGVTRVRLVAVVDAAEADAAVVRGYEDRVLDLLGSHGGVLEQRLFSADGRTEVQTISFADEAGLQSFMADPRRAAYRMEVGDAAPRARVIRLAG